MATSDFTTPPIIDEWRDIPGYEGRYRVSDHGKICSLLGRNPRILRAQNHAQGYRTVCLRRDGESHSFLIHRLVLLAFTGEPSTGQIVNHKNGDKTDNRLSNLEYCSYYENIHHAIDILGISYGGARSGDQRGENNNGAKLTETDVIAIKAQFAQGVSCYRIARERGLSSSAIENIKNGRTWVHVNLHQLC